MRIILKAPPASSALLMSQKPQLLALEAQIEQKFF